MNRTIKEETTLFPLRGYNNNDDYQTAKTPAVKAWQKHEGINEDDYNNYIDRGHWLGLALKNTTVVDLDRVVNKDTGEIVQDGHDTGKLVTATLRAMGYSFHAIHTPNGYQFIFNHTEGITNNTKNVTSISVIADYRVKDKGYIVYPTENTDGRYFVNKSDKPLSDVPDFLKPMKPYHKNIKFLLPLPVQEGQRNDLIFRWLCEVVNFQSDNQVRAVGGIIADYLSDPMDSKDRAAIDKTIESALSRPKREIKKTYQINIQSNGLPVGNELKEALQQRRYKELEEIHKAWEAEGKNGRKPGTISTIRCAMVLKEYVNFIVFDLEENTKLSMYLADEGIYTQNTTLIQRVISWLEPRHNKVKADEVMYYLKNNSDVKEKTNSRYLIPVKNGVFNLENKQLEKFTPDYVFTSKVNTNYYDNPALPNINGWNVEEWIKEIACYDGEIVRLLWQVINDSLNGNYTRKKAIFLVGEGNNGKGTYQELLSNLIGSNNIATLKANEFDERFRLSVLQGKTAVIGDDVPPNVYIDDSSSLKSVITGDTVSVEQKNQPLYSASFKCTVIQSTNGMPKFRDKTAGVLRRFIIVPFKADFEVQAENSDIKDDFIKRPEVLEYVLNKAINLDFETFDIPKVSMQALDEFKQDNDPVYEFKSEVFDMWNIPEVPKNLVYAYYKEFCEENGYKSLSVRKFHNEFKKHLSSNWQTETQAKFTEEKLNRYIGNIKDNKYVEWNYPDSRKPYKTYKQDLLKVV